MIMVKLIGKNLLNLTLEDNKYITYSFFFIIVKTIFF
jgi:hypothetical protein